MQDMESRQEKESSPTQDSRIIGTAVVNSNSHMSRIRVQYQRAAQEIEANQRQSQTSETLD